MKSIAQFIVILASHDRNSPSALAVPANLFSFVNAFNSASWQTSSASASFRVKRRASRRRLPAYGRTRAVNALWSPFWAAFQSTFEVSIYGRSEEHTSELQSLAYLV